MKSKTILICATLCAAVVAAANPVMNYQSAKTLYRQKKYAEAEAVLVKVIESKPSRRLSDACLAQAAYCAERRDDNEKALGFADQIKNQDLKTFCRMRLLEMAGKWKDLIALAKDEDFETWPEYLMYDAYLSRAKAHLSVRDFAASEKDYQGALRHTVEKLDKASVNQFLGSMYLNVAKDDPKAFAAYGEVVRLMSAPKPSMTWGMLGRALIARAKILAAQGKTDDALAELAKLESVVNQDAHWSCALAFHTGEIHELVGNMAEALKHYKQAAATPNAPEYLTDSATRKITSFEADK